MQVVMGLEGQGLPEPGVALAEDVGLAAQEQTLASLILGTELGAGQSPVQPVPVARQDYLVLAQFLPDALVAGPQGLGLGDAQLCLLAVLLELPAPPLQLLQVLLLARYHPAHVPDLGVEGARLQLFALHCQRQLVVAAPQLAQLPTQLLLLFLFRLLQPCRPHQRFELLKGQVRVRLAAPSHAVLAAAK
jgi:hypothetical protein